MIRVSLWTGEDELNLIIFRFILPELKFCLRQKERQGFASKMEKIYKVTNMIFI